MRNMCNLYSIASDLYCLCIFQQCMLVFSSSKANTYIVYRNPFGYCLNAMNRLSAKNKNRFRCQSPLLIYGSSNIHLYFNFYHFFQLTHTICISKAYTILLYTWIFNFILCECMFFFCSFVLAFSFSFTCKHTTTRKLKILCLPPIFNII